MKKAEKRIMLIGAGLVLVGIVLFVGMFALNGFDSDAFARHVSYKRTDYTLAAEFDRLIIADIDADIHIQPGEDDECNIIYDANNRQSYSIEAENGTLEIRKAFNWMDYVSVNLSEPELTIYLPAKKYASLSVDAVSGDVHLKNIAAEVVQITTVSGDVRLDGLAVDQLSVSSDSGDVKIENSDIYADADIRTVNGDVIHENSSVKNFHISSVSGDVVE